MTKPEPGRVCVLHVGGTIGMLVGPGGAYEPRPGFLGGYLERLPELDLPEVPPFDLVELDPLLDSADVGPAQWTQIAQEILSRYRDYAGFVVVHGTDTMAYTASALSFLLPGLDKPVVLTGAQISLMHPRSDGREHMITSLMVAGSFDIPEVAIYFASRLLRGNRAQKVHNQDFVAFDSGNLPPLASVGARITANRRIIRDAGSGPPSEVKLDREPTVAAIRLFPGMTASMLDNVLSSAPDAIVLETYGVGNAPSRDPRLFNVLEEAIQNRDLVVVNCSQCHGGSVHPAAYETGAGLVKIGVTSGVDMTPEAALTKLYCLLAEGHGHAQVRTMMGQDLAGELTVSLETHR